MRETSRWTPGLRCGPGYDRDQYTLVRHRHTGFEGELWQATRATRDGEIERCAVKILALPDDDTPDGRTHWLRRWADGISRANRVRTGALVIPIDHFVGAPPHPAGTAGDGDVPYLVSPWIDAETLEEWALRLENGLEQRLVVLGQLCQAVDELHRNSLVHRDISAANVLVDAGDRPYLIDFTFLAPVGGEVTMLVRTPGYAAPHEEKLGGSPDPAKDRFGVGALARMLLLPDAPRLPDFDAAATTRRQLLEHGYDSPVADWLIQALEVDPRRRPEPLVPWARRLRELVSESERRPDYSCVALCGDGRLGTVVVSGGRHGVAYHTPTDEVESQDAFPPTRHAPRAIKTIAAARNATGQLIIAAIDSGATLWLGSSGAWTTIAHEAEGLAMLAAPRGEMLVWTVHRGSLSVLRVKPGSARTPSRHAEPGERSGRVVAAAWHGREPVVLTAEADRLVAHRWPPDAPDARPEQEVVLGSAVDDAALAVGRSGELETFVLCDNGEVRALRRHFSGEWLGQPPPLRTVRAEAAAMTSIRGGAALAVADQRGLRVLTPREEPAAAERTILFEGLTSAVALCQGQDWRLRIVAVVDDKIRYWAESWGGGNWNAHALETRRPS